MSAGMKAIVSSVHFYSLHKLISVYMIGNEFENVCAYGYRGPDKGGDDWASGNHKSRCFDMLLKKLYINGT